MGDVQLFAAFVVAATLLAATPGVDTAIVLRTVTFSGRKQGLKAAAGIAAGCLVWGAGVSAGLGVLLRASELAYTVVKFAGAAYLLWLGLNMLLQPRATMASSAAGAEPAAQHAFWRGFLANLLNPKVGVFYVTFLPQFVPAGTAIAGYSFFLACVHVALTLLWFCGLIAATVPLGRLLAKPSVMRAMDRLTGAVLIGFGVRLARSSAV